MSEEKLQDAAGREIRLGMQFLAQGNIQTAIERFDAAERLLPSVAPRLWQRGIAYYYAGEYGKGADQFKLDLEVNSHDVEESIWHFMCNAMLKGIEFAQKELLEIDDERRAACRLAYETFRGEIAVEQLEDFDRESVSKHDRFYRELYAGLWYEVNGNEDKARECMLQAARDPLENDYMSRIAVMHCQFRHWHL